MRSEKRKTQETNSNTTPESASDEIYPGHLTFGELTKKSSFIKTLPQLRNDVPDYVRGHLDDIVKDLTRPQKKHFLKVVASLSDDQYHHVLTHITRMFDKRHERSHQFYLRRGVCFFRIGILILAGDHPHTKEQTHAWRPRPPIVPQIKMPDVFQTHGRRYRPPIVSQTKTPGVVDLTFGSPEWLELIERLENLPLELYDMIKEWVFNSVNYYYPHHDHHSGVYDAGKCSKQWLQGEHLEMFQAPAQGQNQSQQTFCNTLYVIGAGDVAATTKFITHASAKLQKELYRLKLIFSREDFYITTMESERPTGNYQGLCDEFLLFMDADRPHTRDSWSDTTDCPKVWIQKIDLLRWQLKTDIKELELDLTNAYTPDGKYMGLRIARRFIFKEDEIPEVTIRAPSIEQELQIHRVILEANGIVFDDSSEDGSVSEEIVPQLEILAFDE